MAINLALEWAPTRRYIYALVTTTRVIAAYVNRPSLTKQTMNRDMSEQVVIPMMLEVPTLETSLTNKNVYNEQRPTNIDLNFIHDFTYKHFCIDYLLFTMSKPYLPSHFIFSYFYFLRAHH